MKIWAPIVLLLPALMTAPSRASAATLLGVLEEPQCKEDTGTSARVLFATKAHHWIALADEESAKGHIPEHLSWDVALDGRKVGTIETIDRGFSTRYAWTYSRDRLLDLAPGQATPHFPNTAQQFTGWCQPPRNRPLVLVSGGGVTDPDRWRPSAVAPDGLARLFSAFKAQAGSAFLCPKGSETAAPFNYGLKDIESLKSYKDKNGRLLVTLHLKPREDSGSCDGPIDAAWDTHSFFLTATKITYLGIGIELVDAGDYNEDGQSEALFWFTEYNNDGYVLFSNSFASRTEYLWSYH